MRLTGRSILADSTWICLWLALGSYTREATIALTAEEDFCTEYWSVSSLHSCAEAAAAESGCLSVPKLACKGDCMPSF